MATLIQEWLEDLKRSLFGKSASSADVGNRFAEVRTRAVDQDPDSAFTSADVDDRDSSSAKSEIETELCAEFGGMDLFPGFDDDVAELEEREESFASGALDPAESEARGLFSALAIMGERRMEVREEPRRQEPEDGSFFPQGRKGPLRRRASPEESELKRKRAKFSELEGQLTERELLAANLQSELSSLKARYLKNVGPRYADLDELHAKIAELQARSRPLDSEAQREARRARRQAERSRSAVQQLPLPPPSPPSSALKRLYREVAKRIHPDLGAGPADRAVRAQLMARANRAFLQRSEARLREIVEDYECSPEIVSGADTASELVRIIRRTARVKRRLGDIDRSLEQLEQSELYRLKVKADEKSKLGADLLQDMARRIDERIARAKQKLEELAEEIDPD